MSTEGSPISDYEISIEGAIQPWGRNTISVAEIRELGGFPQDAPVVAVNLEDAQKHVLSEDAVHELPPLEPGKPSVKRVNFVRGE